MNIKVITVTYLEDDVFDGDIPRECYENAREDITDVEDTDEAVALIQRAGLTFAATGTEWAADPDGSQIVDYGTGRREEVSAHLTGFTPRETDEIMRRVG